MLKKQSIYFACIITLYTIFLQSTTHIPPVLSAQSLIKPPIATVPIKPPAFTLQNNTYVLSQPNNRQVSISNTISVPKIPSPPVPVHQNIQQKIQQAITHSIPQPVLPNSPKFSHPPDSSPLAFATILTAGIAYHFGNSNPAPGRTQQKKYTLGKKNAHLNIVKKTGLEHIIDQQYARLSHIAREYEKALQKNSLYQSGAHKKRILKRIKAIKEWQSNPKKSINYNHFQKSLHSYIQKASSAYTTITADPIQRTLHKEIISIGEELANFQALDPKISGYLCNCAMLFMDISQTYNGNNIIVQAMNAADVCWEIIEAAHTAGPEIFFSKQTELIWQQYFVYSQAQLPQCTVDWDHFTWEKTRWGLLQKQCKELVKGCTVLIRNTQAEIEKNISVIGPLLSRVAKTIDNFLLNEVTLKIDSFCRLISKTTSKITQQCKQQLVDLVSKTQEKATDFITYLYNQIAAFAQKGATFVGGAAMNTLTLYLVVGLFSTEKNPIKLKTAALLTVIMKLIHAPDSTSTLVRSTTQMLLRLIQTHPIQALIIGAALLTPIISTSIEEYRARKNKLTSVTLTT